MWNMLQQFCQSFQILETSLEVAPTKLATFLADRKIKELLLLIYSFKFRYAFLDCLFETLATPRSAIPVAELLFTHVIVNFVNFDL